MSTSLSLPFMRSCAGACVRTTASRSLWTSTSLCQASLVPPTTNIAYSESDAHEKHISASNVDGAVNVAGQKSSLAARAVPSLRTQTGAPQVYARIRQTLLDTPDIAAGIDSTPDHIEALKRAQHVVRTGRLPSSSSPVNRPLSLDKVIDPKDHPSSKFFQRLAEDGGEKILHVKQSVLHVEHSRFHEPFASIKGLSLNEALRQLAWNQKPIARRTEDALLELIVIAKEKGFDLSRTYVAEAFSRKNAAILSQRLVKKYLRGRGRYGATPHIKTSLVEIVLQERERPFAVRECDPLEWIRVRLRQRFDGVVPNADELYAKRMASRPIKPVYI